VRACDGSPHPSLRSTLLLLAVLLPFAIATHFIGELGALGIERDLPVVFSPHHLYLVLVLLAAFVTGVLVRDEGTRSGSRAVANLIARLPMRGEGPGFVALCVAVQVLFFEMTQVIEGSPISAGDAVYGFAVAAVTSVLSSIVVARLERELFGLALRICRTWFVARRSAVRPFAPARPPVRTARRRWAILFTRAGRPPPALRPVA